MEVCRMRDTPVIVFINKMDRDGKNRFRPAGRDRKELNLQLHPMTWPINSGKDFKGVYNLHDKSLLLFKANTKGTDDDAIGISDLSDPLWKKGWERKMLACCVRMLELVDGVYGELDNEAYLSGR
jgi:peptide chain release factor 3